MDADGLIARLALISRPLQAMLAQGGRVDPEDLAGSTFDLLPIWHAARADPGLAEPPPITPRRFVEQHDGSVRSVDDSDPTRFLVDGMAALSYVAEVDPRFKLALGEAIERKFVDLIEVDPIRAGVAACRGGGSALFRVALPAMKRAGMSAAAYMDAILVRANREAAAMDPHDGERLVAMVQAARRECVDLACAEARKFDPKP